MGACGSSHENAPRAGDVPEDLQVYVATARRRLAHGELVIPCEATGTLHGNSTGPLRGFSSAEAMHEYQALHLQRIPAASGSILDNWHTLDSDFTFQHFSLASSPLPPYRQLHPKIRQAMLRSESAYRKAFQKLPEKQRAKVDCFEDHWPLTSTAEELKECCLQPQHAASMMQTYEAGVQQLELLHQFSVSLARFIGSTQRVEWSVKRPWRLWRKTIENYPEDFAVQDFRHCSDVFRTGVVAESMDQIQQSLDVLERLGRDAYDPKGVLQLLGLRDIHADFLVERIKNRFRQPCLGGYMDVIANIRINGYVTEIQLHLRSLIDLKAETGRRMHKWFKSFLRHSGNYTGERTEDGLMHGKGTFHPVSGGRYDGEFKNGLRHGKGTLYFPNGDRYEGEFFEGKKHGKGTFAYASGNCYAGDFAHDRMDGNGTFSYVNGDRFEGEYSGGKRHGEGAFYYSNGSSVQGAWWYNKHVTVVHV